MAKHVVVSLSGGMDSSTLLLRCLKEYDTVTALSFDYGQKHRVELEAHVKEMDSARKREIEIATSEFAPTINKIVTPILALGTVSLTFILFLVIIFGVCDKTGTCDSYFGFFKNEDDAKKELKIQPALMDHISKAEHVEL